MAISKKEILNYDSTAVEPKLAYINVATSDSNNDYISLGFKPVNSKSKKDMKFLTFYMTKDGGTEDNEIGYLNIAYLMKAITNELNIKMKDVEDVQLTLLNNGIDRTASALKDLFEQLEEETTEESWDFVEKEIKVKGNTYKQFNIYFKPKKAKIKSEKIREIFLR